MLSTPPPRAPPSLTNGVASPTPTMAPLPDDLIPGILLRLPPDDPAGIVRCSAVCKTWRRILADPTFTVLYRSLHPSAPPVLAFLYNNSTLQVSRSRFVPTTSFCPLAADQPYRHALDCRHGRAIFYDNGELSSFVVWDPISGDVKHKIPGVSDVLTHPAVVCAAAGDGGGCDHRRCGGGHFVVAFVGIENIHEDDYYDAHACCYSSDTGDRSVDINIHLDHGKYELKDRAAALVGDTLYFVGRSGLLLRYRYGLLRRCIISAGFREADVLSVIEPPAEGKKRLGDVIVMKAEDGGVGLAGMCSERLITLWVREETKTNGHVGGDGGQWVKSRVIDLKKLILAGSDPKRGPCLSGVTEDGGVIYVSSKDGVLTVELKSSQVKKLKLANGKLSAPIGNQ